MITKLAILVVYIITPEYERLFHLHLERIERHTQVPYQIYAGVNRLLPEYRQRLERHPKVRCCDLPHTDQRGVEEHSHYLGHLASLASDDGATHLATLHMDSFPVRDGWASELMNHLSGNCVLATIEGIDTACLLFRRDFYLNCQPRFFLTEEEQASADFKKYVQEVNPILHSGVGYGFAAYRNDLSWYYLRRTSGNGDRTAPKIYDDLFFHLGGAVRLSTVPSTTIPAPIRKLGYERFEAWQRALHAITPNRLRLMLRSRLRRPLEVLIDQTRVGWQFGDMQVARDQLLRDPATYIEQLRRSS